MGRVAIPAHFDGDRITLETQFKLERDMKLVVIVLTENDDERESWLELSRLGLESAFGEDEPEYGFESIIEANPDYARG